MEYAGERVTAAPSDAEWAELVSPNWRGTLGELGAEAMGAFWAEAVGYARWEIGRYARWRGQDEPVLAGGYDAEGVAQAAFARLISREAGGQPIAYRAEDIRRELRVLIKRRVRWLHERCETRLAVGEWDVLPPRPDGERVSVFDYLAGGIARPDEALMRKEKELLLGEFKAGFERTLGARKELLEVFRRVWDGERRREIERGLREVENGERRQQNEECGMLNREGRVQKGWVKALQAQVRRRLARFGTQARGGVAEMLQGVRES